jgi:hypothetical protein
METPRSADFLKAIDAQETFVTLGFAKLAGVGLRADADARSRRKTEAALTRPTRASRRYNPLNQL